MAGTTLSVGLSAYCLLINIVKRAEYSDRPVRKSLWQWSISRHLTLTYWFNTSVFESLNLKCGCAIKSFWLLIACLFVCKECRRRYLLWSCVVDCSLLLNANVSCFSAGNLGRVDYISEFEFDLFIRPDTCNPRFRVWFNFTVENVRETQVSMLRSYIRLPLIIKRGFFSALCHIS